MCCLPHPTKRHICHVLGAESATARKLLHFLRFSPLLNDDGQTCIQHASSQHPPPVSFHLSPLFSFVCFFIWGFIASCEALQVVPAHHLTALVHGFSETLSIREESSQARRLNCYSSTNLFFLLSSFVVSMSSRSLNDTVIDDDEELWYVICFFLSNKKKITIVCLLGFSILTASLSFQPSVYRGI